MKLPGMVKTELDRREKQKKYIYLKNRIVNRKESEERTEEESKGDKKKIIPSQAYSMTFAVCKRQN